MTIQLHRISAVITIQRITTRDHSTNFTPLDPLQIEDSGSFFCAATILTINLYLIDEFQKRSKPWIAEIL